VKTAAVSTHQLMDVLEEFGELDPDIYGNRQQLRMIVMGSLEVVSIAENRPVIIGRGENADLDVRSYGHIARSVSRRHAQISLADGRLSIIDLGSRNGTTVSGRKLEVGKAAFIHRDDVIKVGHITMSVVF
jgi:pSer/pThr/pTyr-binding forkhead associated (FHA) protein